MKQLTKSEIQERQLQIMNEMYDMEEKSRESNNGAIVFSEEDGAKYDALVRESAGLSVKAKALASGEELKVIRENEDKGKKLREEIARCAKERAAATTILANKITSGGDQNANANLEAGGLIPTRIEELIDTKVAGIELPDSLKMVTGVTGNQVIPYSTNDVKFTVEGEVTKVDEQKLDFTHITADPKRIAASVPVSFRAIDNAAFDIVGFIVFKMQKGWAMFRALHIYAHGEYTALKSPFADVTAVELTMDENIGKNLATEIAEMYDLGFVEDPELIMDKVTEVALEFTPRIPNSTGERTVIEGGKCVGYNYKVSPFIDYAINSSGIASKDDTYSYIGIGHFGYLAEQQHGEFRMNIDGTSQANFDRGTVSVGVSTDYSLTDLSKKVNGGSTSQGFKLIKLIPASSDSETI